MKSAGDFRDISKRQKKVTALYSLGKAVTNFSFQSADTKLALCSLRLFKHGDFRSLSGEFFYLQNTGIR